MAIRKYGMSIVILYISVRDDSISSILAIGQKEKDSLREETIKKKRKKASL